MVNKIIQEVTNDTVVVMMYRLSQPAGDNLYGIGVINLTGSDANYKIYHLRALQLVDLWNNLPRFTKTLCNFSIEKNQLMLDNYIKHLVVPEGGFSLFEDHEFEFKQNFNFWYFLRVCLINHSPLVINDQEVFVEQLRFSDSTPNVLASIQNSDAKFSSKIIYSLDNSVELTDLRVKLKVVPVVFKQYLQKESEDIYRVNTRAMPSCSMDKDEFCQILCAPLFITLLDYREYYKCMCDAVSLIKYFHKLVNSELIQVSSKPAGIEQRSYACNCRIKYQVSKPSLSMLKKPWNPSGQECFLEMIKGLLDGSTSVTECYSKVGDNTVLGQCFVTTLNAALSQYCSKGLDAVNLLNDQLCRMQAFYALEVFRWKAAMVYFNELPIESMGGISTRLGILNIGLEG